MATEAERMFRQTIETMQLQIQGVMKEIAQARGDQPGVGERIREIERRIQAMEGRTESREQRSGLAKIFDGKNPRLLPPTFAKEEGVKTFRKWATQVETYVELADP
eukprot:1991565-Karenia_brevis.AAC.1